ncbi:MULTISPECIES: hypothetical protein [unclassified Lysobacter]|uniref:hypothetical protein n=1 Tax=unclassified Lysobacter TaxID=2635362 RepID=UPI000700E033|nr:MULTISPECIES: hypothetical protein [unclassified Lysobacter]KRC36736.1 hypothetical protein ASE10_06400 [Lysobacter sp. Root76]KRD66832.1 hypothetical protein ASE45_16055 [Lysobacter sp. Root96]
MEIKVEKAVAAALAGVLCMACTSAIAKGKAPAARYPAALHGVWLGEDEDCKNPDIGDSDTRFEVAATKLTGYEHWNKPLRIVQISKDPLAWRMISETRFDGSVFELQEVYVLSGYKNGTLTIVDSSQSRRYERCQ